MDDAATPTPTPTTPPKSIDGMTPGSKPAMPANDAATPTAIDINKLDGDSLDVSPAPSTNDMGTPPPATSTSMDKPSAPIDDVADEAFTIPKPGTTFDAKAAEAAMNEEDKEPESLTPENPRLGSTKFPPASPKKKGRGLAIAIAVIIALALIGGASYAFWKNNNDKKATTKDTTTTTTTSVSETVTTASDGIDTELNKIDDTKEFQSTDISDTTLGL
jgi:hypothetical protein